MKRRVLILPLSDETNYKEEHLDELTTKRLVSRLENTGTIIPVTPVPWTSRRSSPRPRS